MNGHIPLLSTRPRWLSKDRAEQISKGEAAVRPEPRRVIIADESHGDRLLLAALLRKAGFEPIVLSTGDELLDRLYDDDDFAALLIDLRVAKVEASETVKLIRFKEAGDARGKRLSIIGINVEGGATARQDCSDAGADACLTTPLDPGLVITTLKRLLEDREVATERTTGKVVRLGERLAFRPGVERIVKPERLRELYEIGGGSLLRELAETTRVETATAMGNLVASVASGDIQAFRLAVAKLLTHASNLGGVNLDVVSSHTKSMTLATLTKAGPAIIDRLRREATMIADALDGFAAREDELEKQTAPTQPI